MTKAEFFELCKKHDWFYDWSEDSKVWNRGDAQRTRLKQEIAKAPDLEPIYTAWAKHHFSGESYRTAKEPEPKLEDFEVLVS